MRSLEIQTRFSRLFLGLFTLLLVWSTLPLWSSPPTLSAPQIPWHDSLLNVPFSVDLILLGGLITSSLCLVFIGAFPKFTEVRKPFGFLYLICLLGLVALDQHRLQPWVIQFLLLGGLMSLANGTDLVRGWKWIIISIYVWSAVSKFDYGFLTVQGPMFLEGLLNPFGIQLNVIPEHQIFWLCLLFPVGELLAAVLLSRKQLCRFGLPFSVLIHLVLIWILGVGLRHESAVIIWNLFFIAQNITIFREEALNAKRLANSDPGDAYQFNTSPQLIPAIYRVVTVSYPALVLVGLCDHWPAWEVYCSRPEQVRVLIHEDATALLPESFKPHLGTPAPLSDQIPLSLDGWSFRERHCPVYPQARYRLALLAAVLTDVVPDESVSVQIGNSPNRFNGKRTTHTLNSLSEVHEELGKYLINSSPRIMMQILPQN